jgi:hypothetical protein
MERPQAGPENPPATQTSKTGKNKTSQQHANKTAITRN